MYNRIELKTLQTKSYSKTSRWIPGGGSNHYFIKRNIAVNVFPRPGSASLRIMISEVANLDFPRKRPLKEIKNCLSLCDGAGKLTAQNCIWLNRDGRDSIKSLCLYSFGENWNNGNLARKTGKKQNLVTTGQ